MAILLPSPEQLETISTLRRGDLAEVPYPVLLLALAEHSRSGVLEISRRPVSKRVVLVDGSPVDCRSNLIHETFGPFLESLGKLTAEQVHAYTSQAMVKGVPLGEVLLAEKVLGASDLYRLLQQNLARKLLDGFTWSSGEFTFTPDQGEGADTTLRVKVPQLVLTGMLKLGELETAQSGLAPWHDKRLRIAPQRRERLDELRLPGRYDQLVQALGKSHGLHELLLATSLSPAEVVRVVYVLALLGIVAPDESGSSEVAATAAGSPAKTPKAAVARPAAPVPPSLPPAPARSAASPKPPEPSRQPDAPAAAPPAAGGPVVDVESVRNYVLETYLSYRRKDAFELLDLEESASNAEMEVAFLAFARRCRPFQLEELGEKDLAEKGRLLLLAAAEALGELKDVDKRNALITRRRTLREERTKRPAAETHIKTDLLDPSLQYRKGLAALESGQLDRALQLLRFASDCDPQNALYLAEAAHCAFIKDSFLNGAKSMKELEQAVRLDDSCGAAHYYLGEEYMEAGRFDDAERHLRRSIKLLSPDRRPIEALKQLATRRAKR